MSDDDDLLSDPQDVEVFASFTCRFPLGVTAVSAERAASLIRE